MDYIVDFILLVFSSKVDSNIDSKTLTQGQKYLYRILIVAILLTLTMGIAYLLI